MRQGPEFRPGWREAFDVGGERVEVIARHATRPRMPRGHEIARQMSRGRPVGMVEETTHEWVALMGHRRATVRVEPSGRFGVPHANLYRDSLRGAVTAWAERDLARRARPEPEAEDAPVPAGP